MSRPIALGKAHPAPNSASDQPQSTSRTKGRTSYNEIERNEKVKFLTHQS